MYVSHLMWYRSGKVLHAPSLRLKMWVGVRTPRLRPDDRISQLFFSLTVLTMSTIIDPHFWPWLKKVRGRLTY